MPDRFAAKAFIYERGGFREGYVIAEGGVIVEEDEGPCPERTDIQLALFPDVVNAHTHCADYGLKVLAGMSLEDLVAPPDGLKHRYLRDTPGEVLSENMRRFGEASASHGSFAFVDFRENGAEGCRLLREACPDAVILGRPVSPEFDPGEIEEILRYADGIGISSVSDMPSRYIEDVADMVRDRRALFAIHVSERVREDIDFVLSLDPTFVVHMCEAEDSDILKCAEAEVPIVVCPGSNMYFGKVPPLSRIVDMGADMALGTDNGMLREPDMIAESSLFIDIMDRQEGDSASVFDTFFTLSRKILNRNIGLGRTIQRRYVTVPFEGEPLPENIFRPGSSGMSLTKRIGSERRWSSRTYLCPLTEASTPRPPSRRLSSLRRPWEEKSPPSTSWIRP